MRIDSIPIGIETILIFILIGFYFYEQINDTENLFIYERPHFWGALGILIYLSGSFFVYISAEKLPLKEVLKYWIITNIASIIKNLFFALAFYLSAKNLTKKKRQPLKLYPTY
jgi:Na+/H+-translocating membrane pyrophosphatase